MKTNIVYQSKKLPHLHIVKNNEGKVYAFKMLGAIDLIEEIDEDILESNWIETNKQPVDFKLETF